LSKERPSDCGSASRDRFGDAQVVVGACVGIASRDRVLLLFGGGSRCNEGDAVDRPEDTHEVAAGDAG